MKTSKVYPILLTVLLSTMVIAGCTKDPTVSLYVPTAADVTATATLADLQQGRTLFINDCGRCHSLYPPESYTPAQWQGIMPMMSMRASLTAAEIQLVLKYVSKGK